MEAHHITSDTVSAALHSAPLQSKGSFASVHWLLLLTSAFPNFDHHFHISIFSGAPQRWGFQYHAFMGPRMCSGAPGFGGNGLPKTIVPQVLMFSLSSSVRQTSGFWFFSGLSSHLYYYLSHRRKGCVMIHLLSGCLFWAELTDLCFCCFINLSSLNFNCVSVVSETNRTYI